MQTRLFALGMGVVYLLVGIVGSISAFYTHPAANAPKMTMTGGYGYLFGQFPVNYLHDAMHVVIGLAGIAAAAHFDAARIYGRVLFLVYGLLTVAGFIPTLNTLSGLVPLFGSDTYLHAVTAVVAAYFGFVAPEPTYVEPAPHMR